jgi:F420-non-reducing hydrogenase large subunit
MIEMAYRAYDPCLACATHLVGGKGSGMVNIYNHKKELMKVV